MSKNLVIVESPAKAKTIEGFLGKEFLVKSSYGHVRDLGKKELGVDVNSDFKPDYQILPDKKSVITELKKLSKKAETVWLATDEDREGEAISWHLCEALGLNKDKAKRIVFHEITKPAILKAIENPRWIDQKLVDAQQARRVLDRLVGFELSPVLWRKVKPSLSAGRVQSVAVRLIVEREKAIGKFKPTASFKVSGVFLSNGEAVKAELSEKFKSLDEAKRFLEECEAASFKISNLEKKPGKRSPAAPFTTSTLQQEASRKLGFSVSKTMTLAQRLYESGKITYMRTDSVNLSNTAVNAAKAEIVKSYGAEYANPRKYVTKAKSAQEAHEAIRPTYMNVQDAGKDYGQQRLYDLIWKRTIASQMADAQLERTTATIDISTSSKKFIAQGEVIKFDGFLKVYIESSEDEDEEPKALSKKGILPPLKVDQTLEREEIVAMERFTSPPPRYSEAALVKKLEELGIGRPSTYAPTISTIQKRGYVVKEERPGTERKYHVLSLSNTAVKEEEKTEITGKEKGKLYPTDVGIVVNDFLVEHFGGIMDYNFTANVEKEFDEIARGQRVWNEMINQFYGPFHENVESTMKTSEKAKGERLLGKDPVSGKNVYVKIGRYGPMVQLGETEDEEKPKFSGLRKNMNMADVTLEQALELFKLPRTVGEFEGEEVTASVGRFGPYVRHNNKFYSLGDKYDPLTITEKEAIQVIEQKREEDRKKIIQEFPENKEVKVLNGKYGPYISIGRKNFKIPKDKDPEQLSLEECIEISKQPKQASGRRKKKKPAK